MTGSGHPVRTTKYLFKANDEVLSHCQCKDAPAMSTGQLDCPWCGCGWLITCTRCGKAFTFAEVRETDLSLMEIGRLDVDARNLENISDDEIAEWAEGMAELLDHFDVGDIVVYLDGYYWTVDSTSVAFDGYHARHNLDRLPHAEAIQDSSLLMSVLGNQQYWMDRELPDRE
jgi:hypothetical protein